MSKKIVVLLFVFIILLLSCNTTDPPIKVYGKINLKLIDVSVTEAYLFISLENNSTKSISVFQDNEIILNFRITENDTIILINNLKESSEYKFKAILKNGAATVDVSKEIKITTLAPAVIFGSVDIKGNTVCIVGEVGLDTIIMGKRTN